MFSGGISTTNDTNSTNGMLVEASIKPTPLHVIRFIRAIRG